MSLNKKQRYNIVGILRAQFHGPNSSWRLQLKVPSKSACLIYMVMTCHGLNKGTAQPNHLLEQTWSTSRVAISLETAQEKSFGGDKV